VQQGGKLQVRHRKRKFGDERDLLLKSGEKLVVGDAEKAKLLCVSIFIDKVWSQKWMC